MASFPCLSRKSERLTVAVGGGIAGGGGAGAFTVTVALAVLVPPGPPAVKVYTVVWPGNTRRVPLAATVPMPGVIVMLVASPVTDHFRVESPPRSMVDGSASKLTIEGATGAGLCIGAGAGGGGGAGVFFLQPEANSAREIANTIVDTFPCRAII